MKKSLQYALNINDNNVKSVFPMLYLNIAKCYEKMGDSDNAERNLELYYAETRQFGILFVFITYLYL
jgi:hypothetical protein